MKVSNPNESTRLIEAKIDHNGPMDGGIYWKARGVKKISADLLPTIMHLFKVFIRPIVSLYNALSNYLITGTVLTSSKALNVAVLSSLCDEEKKMKENYHFFHTGEIEETYKDKQTIIPKEVIKDQFNNSTPGTYITFVHLETEPCLVKHSTMMAFITKIQKENEKPLNYAIFFDAQGHAPEELKLSKVSRPLVALENIKNVYEYLTNEIEGDVPNLVYGNQNIQPDWVSCTGYSAAFINLLTEEIKKDDFNAEDFMQRIQNGEILTLKNARDAVDKIAESKLQKASN